MDEVFELVGRGGRVERHEHGAHSQTGDVERDRFNRLVDLDYDTVAHRNAAAHQSCNQAARQLRKCPIREMPPPRRLDEQALGTLSDGPLEPRYGICRRHRFGAGPIRSVCARLRHR